MSDARERYEAQHCLRYIHGHTDCSCHSCHQDLTDNHQHERTQP